MKTTSDQLSAPNPSTPEATKPSTKLMRDVTLDGVVVITEADDPHRNWFGEVSDAEEYWSLDERFAHADLIVRAVNSYDDMLAALKKTVPLLQAAQRKELLNEVLAVISKTEQAQ